MSVSRLVAAFPFLFVMSCRRGEAPPSPSPVAVLATTTASAPAASVASNVPAVTASPDVNLVPEGNKIDDGSARAADIYLASLGAGRLAAKKGDYPAAIAAFDRASKAFPTDARARAERGFVRLRAGDLHGAAADLESASGLSADTAVDAQIWFNLGLVDEQRGNGEEARVDFALSNLVRPSKAAAEKLRGQSVCTVHRVAEQVDAMTVAANFREVYAHIDSPPPKVPLTEAQAKQSVCAASGFSDYDQPDERVCDKKPPWLVCRDSFQYRCRSNILFPYGKKILVYDAGVEGGWPGHCIGNQSTTGERVGDVLHVTTTFGGYQSIIVEGVDLPESGHPYDNASCADGLGAVTDDFFDATSGRALMRFRRVILKGAEEPRASIRLEGHTVVLGGDGCHERVALPM